MFARQFTRAAVHVGKLSSTNGFNISSRKNFMHQFKFRMFSTTGAESSIPSSAQIKTDTAVKNNDEEKSVVVTHKNIRQSPLKMRFLVMLIRDRWFPDAMAQMKFTPKRQGGEIGKMLTRAAALARINHNAAPEELWVQEVITTKGLFQKKLRYHGRGGMGLGSKKQTKVRIRVKVLNIPEIIANTRNRRQRERWQKRLELVEQARSGKSSFQAIPSSSTSSSTA